MVTVAITARESWNLGLWIQWEAKSNFLHKFMCEHISAVIVNGG